MDEPYIKEGVKIDTVTGKLVNQNRVVLTPWSERYALIRGSIVDTKLRNMLSIKKLNSIAHAQDLQIFF